MRVIPRSQPREAWRVEDHPQAADWLAFLALALFCTAVMVVA